MKIRNPLDAYYTNSKLVEQLLLKYPVSKHKVILEPCNGKGHISNYLKELGYKVITNDINKQLNCDFNDDATLPILWDTVDLIEQYYIDTVITNPPFNVAEKILEQALGTVDEVIMLLRLSFIEPCKSRRDLLNDFKDNLVKVIPISPRPKFREDTEGSDSVTVAWFIWNKRHSWYKLGISCPFDFITEWKL